MPKPNPNCRICHGTGVEIVCAYCEDKAPHTQCVESYKRRCKCLDRFKEAKARVAELADALDLKSGAARRPGSNPGSGIRVRRKTCAKKKKK